MKQFFAVIDTNVIISAIYNRKTRPTNDELSCPRKVIYYIKTGVIIPYINTKILNEYIRILTKEEFNFDENKIYEILDLFLYVSRRANKIDVDIDLPDITDIPFYAVTLSAREETDAYLVTGNIKDFPREPYIVSPKEMIDIIESKLK